jgi:hypothetical protein
MRRALLSASFVLAVASFAGCYADSQVGYGYAGPTAVVATPNNLYWRYDNGLWYSSRWHDRGWATSYNVPVAVRGIDRPGAYVHYRGNGGYRGGGGGYRDNRGPGYRGAPAAGPVVRDHREAPVVRGRAPVVRDHR